MGVTDTPTKGISPKVSNLSWFKHQKPPAGHIPLSKVEWYDSSDVGRSALRRELGAIATSYSAVVEQDGTIYECSTPGDQSLNIYNNALQGLLGGPYVPQGTWDNDHPKSNLWEIPHALEGTVYRVLSNTITIIPMIVDTVWSRLFPIEGFTVDVNRVMAVRTSFKTRPAAQVAMFGFPRLSDAHREKRSAGFSHYYEGATIGINFMRTEQGFNHFLYQIAVIMANMILSMQCLVINQIENSCLNIYEARKKGNLLPRFLDAFDAFVDGINIVQSSERNVYGAMKHLLRKKSLGDVSINTILMSMEFDRFLTNIHVASTTLFLSPPVAAITGETRLVEDKTNEVLLVFTSPYQTDEAYDQPQFGSETIQLGTYTYVGFDAPRGIEDMVRYRENPKDCTQVFCEGAKGSPGKWAPVDLDDLVDHCLLFDSDKEGLPRETAAYDDSFEKRIYSKLQEGLAILVN